MFSLSISERISFALKEDLTVPEAYSSNQPYDVTSRAVIPESIEVQARLMAKEDGVISGVELLNKIFLIASDLLVETGIKIIPPKVKANKSSGERVAKGEVVAVVSGDAHTLLFGERTALNLICRLSGIATKTAEYVKACCGTQAKIMDTRKTTPLWRDLEKAAVVHGGGTNHRQALFDMVLIKDNHLEIVGIETPSKAVNKAREKYPELPIEVEVVSLERLKEVCMHSQPDFVLLDNLDVKNTAAAVAWTRNYYFGKDKRPLLESSGGITINNVAQYAGTGVDRISIGALTHSVKALDLSLEF